jgi:hypothetical protein
LLLQHLVPGQSEIAGLHSVLLGGRRWPRSLSRLPKAGKQVATSAFRRFRSPPCRTGEVTSAAFLI